MRRRSCLAGLLLILVASPARAQGPWSFEALTGSAYSLKTHLEISQAGYPDLSTRADYATRPFEGAPYYALKLAHWRGDRAWELSLIHHKLYLQNPPAGVGAFSVTHGFNIITVNRAQRLKWFTWHLGAGVVVTHTEAEVRGYSYDGPYELDGLALLAGVSRRYYFTRDIYGVAQVLATLAYARSSPSGAPDLTARISNAAIHGQIGLGYDF